MLSRRSKLGEALFSPSTASPPVERAALVVTDDTATHRWIEGLLHARGWQVVHIDTASGIEARLHGSSFPLVILDASLSGTSAAELCRRTRPGPGDSPRRIVVLVSEESAEAAALLEDGADDVILCPTPFRRHARATLAARRLALMLETAEADLLHSALARGESAAEASRPGEMLYRHVFERNPQPMWVYDLETLRFLAVNLTAAEKYGYSVDEFLQLTIKDIRPPEDLGQLLENLATAPPVGFDRSGPWRHRTRDGRVLWVEISSHDLLFEGRRARLVHANDITERKEIEQALRESEQLYRALFDASPLGVFHFDRQLRIRGCNARLAQALGFGSPDELVGFDLKRLQDRRAVPAFRQVLAGEPTQYEGPYRVAPRRTRTWIALHLSPLFDARGDVEGGIAIVEDITTRKKAESWLTRQAREVEQMNLALQERSEQLEAALQSRNRLYAALNHELRTPISAIMLYNELLLGGALGPLNPGQAESIQHAQSAAEHLLDLVHDVLDLARLEAGRVRISFEPVRLSELLPGLLETIRPLASRRGSELRVDVSPDASEFETDPRRLRQILLNLLSNAAKFGEGQPILVRSRRAPEGNFEISVTDRGRGIAPQDLARIFEDFVQVGSHPEETGSGLGLSISRRLAELLGGTLGVESEPGKGSTFRLLLPNPAPGATRDPQPPRPAARPE